MTPETSPSTRARSSPGRIVVGIDGSPASIDALDWAGRQAHLTHATLEMIMTWDWPTNTGWTMYFPEDYDPSDGMAEILRRRQTTCASSTPISRSLPGWCKVIPPRSWWRLPKAPISWWSAVGDTASSSAC